MADLLRGDYKQSEYGKVITTQALNSIKVRNGLRDILLNHAGLWEALRAKGAQGAPGAV